MIKNQWTRKSSTNICPGVGEFSSFDVWSNDGLEILEFLALRVEVISDDCELGERLEEIIWLTFSDTFDFIFPVR